MKKSCILILLMICIAQGAPIKYCYSGEICDYSSFEAYEKGPLNIVLEIVSNAEIRTFELPDGVESSRYFVNYEATLQNLWIGEKELVTTPILGEVNLTYGSFGYYFKISFHQDNLNLLLWREEEECSVHNPNPVFEIGFSNNYFDEFSYFVDKRGCVLLNNVEQVPEPTCISIVAFAVPLLLMMSGCKRRVH